MVRSLTVCLVTMYVFVFILIVLGYFSYISICVVFLWIIMVISSVPICYCVLCSRDLKWCFDINHAYHEYTTGWPMFERSKWFVCSVLMYLGTCINSVQVRFKIFLDEPVYTTNARWYYHSEGIHCGIIRSYFITYSI